MAATAQAAAAQASDTAKHWWGRAKVATGLAEEIDEEAPNSSLLSSFNEATTLSKTQRVYGFGICVGCAICFGFLSTLFVVMPTKFAVLFTFSQMFAIASTFFLTGPWTQLKNMMKKGRGIAALIYFGSMVLVLFCAIKLHSAILTLLAMIVQLGALAFYCASFIPFAQQMMARAIGVEMSF
mmetsp:Transcript_20227/g.60965  ORF Transcript_20227/g.60965 Transcript_20227/m.60965 type:complete len:182 (-) Transcript_20227:2554-3099(-)